MARDEKITVRLTRRQAAPRNVAARALAVGQFQPKVEPDPKAYKRRAKHKRDPLLDTEKTESEPE